MTPPKARILCIEDNPVNWRLVQRLLEQAGYEMHWAEEGLRGYALALELKPDLILLDINLPGLSGFEVAVKLRQNPQIGHIPVVALTAKTQKSDRETALVAGCTGFIGKPIDPFRFVDQVAAYLGGRRDAVEESREGVALRQFGQQVVEHLEAQLRDAQEANRKLLTAQTALEVRNRSLSRLLHLSRGVLAEHEAGDLIRRTLEALGVDLELDRAAAYRMDAGGGFLDGLSWAGGAFQPLAALPAQAPFAAMMAESGLVSPLHGEALMHSRYWEEGLTLGLWSHAHQACLLPLRGSGEAQRFAGLLALARPSGRPFQPEEAELAALHGGLAQAGLENAGLIASLNESSRALAGSYERLEGAYQDLQAARVALGQQERQTVLGEVFLNMARRLERPVAALARQCGTLARIGDLRRDPADPAWDQEVPGAVAGVREATTTMDLLVKALLRRAGRSEAAPPEWLDLHEVLAQELLFLEADGTLPEGVRVDLDLQARETRIFGVYDDFAEILGRMAGHAAGGPERIRSVRLRTTSAEGRFALEVLDDGGPILPERLAAAFEPFKALHAPEAVLGIRAPGEGLAHCAQILAAYQGIASLRNEGDGTAVRVEIPLV